MAAERFPVQVACRLLAVSESGYYQRLTRPPSERAIRHAWLTDLITQIHTESRGIYGGRRIHAELTLGHGITVGHGQVELLMHRAGLQGVTGRPDLLLATAPPASEWAARPDPGLARLGLSPDQCGALVALVAGSRRHLHNGTNDSLLRTVRAALHHHQPVLLSVMQRRRLVTYAGQGSLPGSGCRAVLVQATRDNRG